MRRAILASMIVALAGRMAGAEEAYQSYEAGVKALNSGNCQAAVSSFQAAIAKDGKESAKKRTYGMNFIQYYPHVYLAKALACAGDKAKAMEEVQIAESQGAYRGGEIASIKAQIATPTPAPTTPTPPPTVTTPSVDPKLAAAQKAADAGFAAYQKKDWERAVASFKEALANDGANAQAKKYLPLALKEQAKKQQVDGAVAAAQSFFNSKKFVEAKAKADEALRLDPQNTVALDLSRRAADEALKAPTPTLDAAAQAKEKAAEEAKLGKQAALSGDWPGAFDHYTAANRLDPGNADIIQALAEASKEKDKAELARKADGEIKQARDLMAASSYSEAKKHADQALALDPGNQDARRLLSDINAALARAVPPTTPPSTATATPVAGAAKEKLRDGVRAFYSGKYDDALEKLGNARADLQALPAFHLYVGASYFSKYLLAGEQDASLKQNAVAEFKRARELDPAFRPDPKVLSPRIVEAFQTTQ